MIQRYGIMSNSHDSWFVPSELGDYVSFKDHLAELEAEKNRVCECHNKQAPIDAKIRWDDNKINYCPYCGGKIEIKGE